MRIIFVIFILISVSGCGGVDPAARDIQASSYREYLNTISKPIPLWKCDNCTITGNIEVYQGGNGMGNKAISPPVEIESPSVATARAFGIIGSRVVDTAAVFLPWYWVSKAAENVLIKGFDEAGHNTNISNSGNSATSVNGFNGDYRDFGALDQSVVTNTFPTPVVVVEPTIVPPVVPITPVIIQQD